MFRLNTAAEVPWWSLFAKQSQSKGLEVKEDLTSRGEVAKFLQVKAAIYLSPWVVYLKFQQKFGWQFGAPATTACCWPRFSHHHKKREKNIPWSLHPWAEQDIILAPQMHGH